MPLDKIEPGQNKPLKIIDDKSKGKRGQEQSIAGTEDWAQSHSGGFGPDIAQGCT